MTTFGMQRREMLAGMVGVAALVGLIGQDARAMVMDDFNATGFVFDVASGPNQLWPLVAGAGHNRIATDAPGSGVGGAGTRTVGLSQPAAPAVSATAIAQASMSGSLGYLDYAGSLGSAGTLVLTYDLAGLDLTGLDTLEIDFLAADLSLADLEISVDLLAADASVLAVGGATVTHETVLDVPLVIPFDVGVSAAKFLRIGITAGSGNDYQLDAIRLVPEPASLALLGLAATPILARRRA